MCSNMRNWAETLRVAVRILMHVAQLMVLCFVLEFWFASFIQTTVTGEKCISVIRVNVTCIMSAQNISAIMCGKQLCQDSLTSESNATEGFCFRCESPY